MDSPKMPPGGKIRAVLDRRHHPRVGAADGGRTERKSSLAGAYNVAQHGEQWSWMVVVLAAMLGQIGLPGGGCNFAGTTTAPGPPAVSDHF